MLQRNKAVQGFDRTHNFQFYGQYEIPAGRGKGFASHGVAAAVLGGWQVNWILSRYSGTPFTITTAGTSVNAPGNTQTADQVLPNVAILGGHGSGQPYFDSNAFAPVNEVRFGNAGRNTVRGPGVFNVDSSLFRNFKIVERFTLRFRAECFNVSNTAQFGNPGVSASSVVRNADGSIRSLGGFTEITTASAERQFRFALKFIF